MAGVVTAAVEIVAGAIVVAETAAESAVEVMAVVAMVVGETAKTAVEATAVAAMAVEVRVVGVIAAAETERANSR